MVSHAKDLHSWSTHKGGEKKVLGLSFEFLFCSYLIFYASIFKILASPSRNLTDVLKLRHEQKTFLLISNLFLQPCSYQLSCMWVTRYLYTYLVLHHRVTMTHNRNISPWGWYLQKVQKSQVTLATKPPVTIECLHLLPILMPF